MEVDEKKRYQIRPQHRKIHGIKENWFKKFFQTFFDWPVLLIFNYLNFKDYISKSKLVI